MWVKVCPSCRWQGQLVQAWKGKEYYRFPNRETSTHTHRETHTHMHQKNLREVRVTSEGLVVQLKDLRTGRLPPGLLWQNFFVPCAPSTGPSEKHR
mmetsp:Transcript_16114/g.35365  ORF Transcript_16114/g.35365 Transcript_16114/m.35365 type:complete len:96 (-) Transcript_16114:1492-1779(-)